MKWKDVLAPGVALAERGMNSTGTCSDDRQRAKHLTKFPASKAAYLCDEGRVDQRWQGTVRHLKLGNLGQDMRRAGRRRPPREFTRRVARDIAADLQPAARRSPTRTSELRSPHRGAAVVEHHGVTINVAGGSPPADAPAHHRARGEKTKARATPTPSFAPSRKAAHGL